MLRRLLPSSSLVGVPLAFALDRWLAARRGSGPPEPLADAGRRGRPDRGDVGGRRGHPAPARVDARDEGGRGSRRPVRSAWAPGARRPSGSSGISVTDPVEVTELRAADPVRDPARGPVHRRRPDHARGRRRTAPPRSSAGTRRSSPPLLPELGALVQAPDPARDLPGRPPPPQAARGDRLGRRLSAGHDRDADAGPPRRRHLRAVPGPLLAAPAGPGARRRSSCRASAASSSSCCYLLREQGATHVGCATDRVDPLLPQRPLRRATRPRRACRPELPRPVPGRRGGHRGAGPRPVADGRVRGGRRDRRRGRPVRRGRAGRADPDLHRRTRTWPSASATTRVVLWDRRRDLVYDDAGVRAKWGVPPASVPDRLALVGDAADGVPGPAGLGRQVGVRRAGAVRAPGGRPGERRRLGRAGPAQPGRRSPPRCASGWTRRCCTATSPGCGRRPTACRSRSADVDELALAGRRPRRAGRRSATSGAWRGCAPGRTAGAARPSTGRDRASRAPGRRGLRPGRDVSRDSRSSSAWCGGGAATHAERPGRPLDVEPRAAVASVTTAPARSAISPAAATSHADMPPDWMNASNRPLRHVGQRRAPTSPCCATRGPPGARPGPRVATARPPSASATTKSSSRSLTDARDHPVVEPCRPVGGGRERLAAHRVVDRAGRRAARRRRARPRRRRTGCRSRSSPSRRADRRSRSARGRGSG